MEQPISRSEKKRRAKNLENLARELVELTDGNIKALPCDDFLKKEISYARGLKAGARKRQIKYITKNLRSLDPSPFFDFLEKKKGSKLKETKTFHDLEYLRDEIIAETLYALGEAESYGGTLDSNWHSDNIKAAITKFPSIDEADIKMVAIKYAKTQKPNFKREVFRILKTGQEQSKYPRK